MLTNKLLIKVRKLLKTFKLLTKQNYQFNAKLHVYQSKQ